MTQLYHNNYMKDIQTIMNTFVERLKDLMLNKGFNIKKLAEYLKLPRTTVNSWLLRKRTPRVDYLYTIADCLGVSIDYLVGREE